VYVFAVIACVIMINAADGDRFFLRDQPD
jgi:hypothetical protein